LPNTLDHGVTGERESSMAIKSNRAESGLFLGNLMVALIGICLLRAESTKKDLRAAVKAEWSGAEKAPTTVDIVRSVEQLARAGAVDWPEPRATALIRLTPEGKRQAEKAVAIIRAGRESLWSERARTGA